MVPSRFRVSLRRWPDKPKQHLNYAHVLLPPVPVQLLLQHWPLPVQLAPAGRLHDPPQQIVRGSPVGLQATQVLPLEPQNASVLPGWQMLPAQQPLEQLVAVHVQVLVVLLHVVPLGQLTQVTPPVPQAVFEVPSWQVLFWQQPLGQLVALHTQLPLEHVVPLGQVTHATPLLPQAALVLPD